MIEALLYEDQSGELTGFRVRGHAGYADKGEDIVCAGVSALVLTAIRSLERFLARPPRVEVPGAPGEGDYFYVETLLPEGLEASDRDTARVILGSLETGLQMMVQDYGKYVVLRRCRYHDQV